MPCKLRKNDKKLNRVESLDYLRGGMAFIIMCYHYAMFSEVHYFDFFLDKFSIYAVSTFYILSGLSLALAYHNKINTRNDVTVYFIRRVFRILPLMWVVISLALFFNWLGDTPLPSTTKIILNYTLLFPIFDIQGYIPVGAWSIGNEMIFYLLFPFLIYLVDENKTFIFIVLFVISLIIALYFAFYVLDSSINLEQQWKYYINHFNQMYLFIAGILIFNFFRYFGDKNKKKLYLYIIPIFIILLIAPSSEHIDLVTKWNRVNYSILFILLTLLFYIGIQPIKSPTGIFFKFLGEVSYSIYLLHPLVAIPTIYILEKFYVSKIVAYFLVSLPLTLLVSYLVYNFFEKPMMNIGKKISYKYKKNII